MKKKVLASVLASTMALSALCGMTALAEDYNVVLVTIDSMDQHWVNMDKGCQKAADELGVNYKWLAPDVKDDAKQI